MSLTTAPMLQEPVNVAPGSIESFPADISPVIFAVAFNESMSDEITFPLIFP